MRKIFTSCVAQFSKLMLLVLALCLGTSAAYAVDDIELQVGADPVQVAAYKTFKGHFTAPATGEVKIMGAVSMLFLDETCVESNSMYGRFNNDYNNRAYFFDVTEGTTYWIYEKFPMMGYDLVIYMDGQGDKTQPLEISYVTPGAGSVFDLVQYDDVRILFNQNVAAEGLKLGFYENGTLVWSDFSYSVTGSEINTGKGGTTLKVKLTSGINSGTINTGDKFVVRLVKARPAKAAADDSSKWLKGSDEDGNYDIEFVVPSVPAELVSSTCPQKFLSYFKEGDPAGMVKLTFNKKVKLTAHSTAVLAYGNIDEDANGNYYYETLPLTVSEDGLTVIADYTGKLRNDRTMLPAKTDPADDGSYDHVALGILNIVDEFGNPVKSPGDATVGSFYFQVPFEVVHKVNVTAEFTPANGTTLNGVDNVEIWVSGADMISFDGVAISYKDGDETRSLVVPMSQLSVSNDPTDPTARIITFAIPAEVKGKKNVAITLNNLEVPDGYDHSFDVQAMYDGFVITFADPANGSEMAQLAEDQVITISTNYSSQYPEMYIMYEIEDMNPTDPEEAVVKSESWMNRTSSGDYTATIPQTVKLVLGHDYHVKFTAWATEADKNYGHAPVGEAYIVYKGLTAPFAFSDLKFESITPEPGSTLPEEEVKFTARWDGMVKLTNETAFILLGSGMSRSFDALTPVDPSEGEDGALYSNIWEMTVSKSYIESLDSDLQISIKAVDMDGKLVEGNTGKEEQSYLLFSYVVSGKYLEFTVSPDGTEPLTSLKEIVASYNGGINLSYHVAMGDAVVMDKSRNIVAKVADVVIPDVPESQAVTYVTLVLNNEITAAGSYVFTIPEDYFMLGDQYAARGSVGKTIIYEITESGEPTYSYEVDPREGNVESLSEIGITFPTLSEASIGAGKATLSIDGGQAIDLPDGQPDMAEWNKVNQPLGKTYTEAGTYVISFPKGYFLNASGDPIQAITLTYTIGAPAPATAVSYNPEPGYVTELSQIELTFTETMEAGGGPGKATISVNGGEATFLPDAGFGAGLNQMIQPLGQTYTEEGTYKINFPEGYFMLDGDGSSALEVVYTIGQSGISAVVVPADGIYRVYNLNGVKVLETEDAAQLKALTPGFYIVNGVKLYVK